MSERERVFWTDEPSALVGVMAQQPMLWAMIGTAIAWLEIGAAHLAFFRALLWPDVISGNIGWVVLVTSTIVAAATFVFLHYFFAVGDAGRHRDFLLQPSVRSRIRCAAWVIIVNIAVTIGMALTQILFWERGPWAHVMEGIRGPSLPIDAFWWPFVFVPAAAFTVWGLAKVWRALRDEALDVARGGLPASEAGDKP